MKNIKYMLFAVMAAVMSSITVSCSTDGNDWEADPTYDRIFTPSSVSISTTGGVSTVTWSTYDKADYYVIEVTNMSPYTLTDDMAEGTALADMIAKWEAGEIAIRPYGGSEPYDKVFGRDENDRVTGTSYTLPEKLASGMYQLRIKGCSTTGRQESHWLYLTKDNDQFFEIGGDSGEEEE